MSYPVYYVPAGDVLPIFFSSFDGGTGASITMTGLAVTDIEIYKDGGVTQRASDAGYTLLDTDGIDFDGLTGIHGFSIDTGDNTDAGFYTVGAWFHVVVSAITIDAQTVSFVAAAFRIMKAESVAGVPKADVDAWLGTAAATPTTAGVPEVDVTHFGGSAGTFASGIPSTVLTTNGNNAVADAVWDENITGHIAANSAGAVLQPSHSGACQAGGSGTTVVLAAGASASDDYYNGDQIFGWVTADRTNFFSDYITDYTGATRTATVTGIPVSPDATYTYVVIPGGTIPGATAPSAAEVADAVADELLSGHTTEGSIGAALGAFHLHGGTAQAGSAASTIVLDSAADSTNDRYNYGIVVIRSGTGYGQSRQITDYVGASRTATVNLPWTITPSTDSEYVIIPGGLDAATVAAVAAGVWAAPRAGNATAGSFGEYVNADAVRVSGDATAADNAESFFDGTGYAGTNNVIPSVTTVTGNVNGNVTGSVGSVTGAVGGAVASVTGAVGSVTAGVTVTTNNDKTGYRLSATGVDDILDEAVTEPGGVFAWGSATLRNIIGWLGAMNRNKLTQTAATQTLRNDADGADLATSTTSDDGTTATRGEWT